MSRQLLESLQHAIEADRKETSLVLLTQLMREYTAATCPRCRRIAQSGLLAWDFVAKHPKTIDSAAPTRVVTYDAATQAEAVRNARSFAKRTPVHKILVEDAETVDA